MIRYERGHSWNEKEADHVEVVEPTSKVLLDLKHSVAKLTDIGHIGLD